MVKTSRMLSGECVRAVYCKVGLEEMSALSVRAAGHTGTVLDTRALRMRGVTTVESVKRNLFGCTDREENRRFVERELARQLEVDSQRWGFDFANERPMPGNHRFAWNLVPASTVPVALRMSPITIATPKQSAPKVTKETKTSSPEAKAQKRITDFLKPRKRLTNSGKKSPAHSHKHECGHGAHIRPPKVARLA